jgi:Fe2+ transport system protein FeoA
MKSQEQSPVAALRTLDGLRPGEVATVVTVDGADVLAQRLGDHGLWAGAEVRLLRRAPFGDPLLFWLHGLRLALRRDEAVRVRVQVAAVP